MYKAYGSVFLVTIAILLPSPIPTLKGLCFEYIPSKWNQLLEYILSINLMTTTNLFLLLNLIVLLLLVSLHLQHKHSSSYKKKVRRAIRREQVLAAPALSAAEFEERSSRGRHMTIDNSSEKHQGIENTPPKYHRKIEANKDDANTNALVETTTHLKPMALVETNGNDHFTASSLTVFSQIDTVFELNPINNHHDETRVNNVKHLSSDIIEKPLPSARFAAKKTSNISVLQETNNHHHEDHHHQGKSLLRTVSRPLKKLDTLEATWKAIQESNSKSSHPHLQHHHHHNHGVKNTRADFKHHAHVPKPRQPKREPSMSHEELNRKVESFIARFNEQIRIQRQQSLLAYAQPAAEKAA